MRKVKNKVQVDRDEFVEEYKDLCNDFQKKYDKAERQAYVEEYLDLCRKYGLVIDCVDDDDHLEINNTALVHGPGPYPGLAWYNMSDYTNYMKGLVE